MMKKKYLSGFITLLSVSLVACSGFEPLVSKGNGKKEVTPPGWVTITGPAANTASQTGVRLTGTCDSIYLAVDLSGDGLLSPNVTPCDNGTFSVDILFSSGDGSKNIIAAQTDGEGTTASDSRTFVLDTTSPNIAITSPGVNANISPTFTISGTCETGITVYLSGTGILTPKTATCSGGTFSTTVAATAGDGTKNFVATQTDAVGNSASNNRDFVRNSAAPVITITQPAQDTAATAGVTLQGTCQAGLTVDLSGTGLQSPNTTTCASGTFSVAITFSADDGKKNITVSQTNGEGVTGSDSRAFVRNNSPFPWKCGSSVEVIWVAPTENVDGTPLVDLAGFKIYYGVSSGMYSTTLDIANPAATTHTISGLTPTLPVYLAMTAYNSTNEESVKTGEAGVLLVDCMVAVVDANRPGKVTYRAYKPK